ncbi:unnamed protein product, partial [Rotaria socialis]
SELLDQRTEVMPLSPSEKYLYNMYYNNAGNAYIVLLVLIYVIILCLGKYWCQLFYWIIEGLLDIKASNIDENEEHTENIQAVTQANVNESVESPAKKRRTKVLIDFYVNLFANERHKGIAAGLFVKLASIMGLHHSIMKHQQDPSMFKRPYLQFAILIFDLSICILVLVLIGLNCSKRIDISDTVPMLLMNLVIMHSTITAIAYAVDAKDWVALLKGPRSISPTSISISDNNRTEELQFETDVALTRKTRRKRSRQAAPGSDKMVNIQ